MDTAGKFLELFGTLITAYGLWFAWNRSSNRRLRRWIEGRYRAIAAHLPWRRRNATVEVQVTDQITVTMNAAVAVHSVGLDARLPIDELLRRISEHLVNHGADLQRLRARVQAIEDGQEVAPAQVEKAIAEAQATGQERDRTQALVDLSIALVGITTTFVGIALGLVAALT